ncbi:MAG: hypothetical protein K2X64_10380, partial [Rhodocyclaceae bacterium]|nr:hypothetical protein [Rhodocyclaceae bacterium]
IAFDPLLTQPQIESIFPVLPTEPIVYAPRPVAISPDTDWRRGTTDAGAKFRARSAVARLRDSSH